MTARKEKTMCNGNDIVILDSEMRLIGYAVGMSQDELERFIVEHNGHADTLKHFEEYWNDRQ